MLKIITLSILTLLTATAQASPIDEEIEHCKEGAADYKAILARVQSVPPQARDEILHQKLKELVEEHKKNHRKATTAFVLKVSILSGLGSRVMQPYSSDFLDLEENAFQENCISMAYDRIEQAFWESK